MMKQAWLLVVCSSAACAQTAAFQDLNFEDISPTVRQALTDGAAFLPPQSVIPGWSLELGSTVQTSVAINAVSETDAWAYLNYSSTPSPVFGNSSFVIQAGYESDPTSSLLSTSLFQTGLVPANANTLSFYAHVVPSAGDLVVSLGGIPLSLVPVAPARYGGYIYAASVSQFAGQTEELKFTVFPGSIPFDFGAASLDNVAFSPSVLVVPEPTPWKLSAVGAALVAVAGALRRRSISC